MSPDRNAAEVYRCNRAKLADMYSWAPNSAIRVCLMSYEQRCILYYATGGVVDRCLQWTFPEFQSGLVFLAPSLGLGRVLNVSNLSWPLLSSHCRLVHNALSCSPGSPAKSHTSKDGVIVPCGVRVSTVVLIKSIELGRPTRHAEACVVSKAGFLKKRSHLTASAPAPDDSYMFHHGEYSTATSPNRMTSKLHPWFSDFLSFRS